MTSLNKRQDEAVGPEAIPVRQCSCTYSQTGASVDEGRAINSFVFGFLSEESSCPARVVSRLALVTVEPAAGFGASQLNGYEKLARLAKASLCPVVLCAVHDSALGRVSGLVMPAAGGSAVREASAWGARLPNAGT